MNTSTAKTPREAYPLLIRSGMPFEVTEEDVLGHRMQVFKNRDRSLNALLDRSLAFGDREYLVDGDVRMTYSEHADAVASLAHALRTRYGVGKGDRVAILSANNTEWVIAFWATVAIGGIAVGLNALWSPPEVAYGLSHCDAKMVVADERRRALLPETDLPVISTEEDVPALCRAHPGLPLPECAVAEDDPAVMLFTSGTSANPKAVLHSHRNVLTAVDFFRFNDATGEFLGMRVSPDRRFLLITPLFHISGLHNLVVPRLAAGDTVIFYSGRFDTDRVLSLIEGERVTNWIGSPTTVSRLAEHGDLSRYDLSSLQAVNVGSAPTPPALVEKVSRVLPVLQRTLATTYGQTESSTAATFALPSERQEYPDSVGLPIVTMQVEIRDPEGRPVPDGVEGEIWLRGPQVMLGYWRNEEVNRTVFGEDRWMRTGDIGTLQSGFLRMTTRRSDLILRGGENVLPMEVEAALAEHPGIVEAAVVGVPHPDLGEEVAAVVVHREDEPISQEELERFLASRLARYKIPTRWTITTRPLPRNATEKVQRRRLFTDS